MLHGAIDLFFIVLASIILVGRVRTVEIFASMDPPTLKVGKAVSLKWNVAFKDDEKLTYTALFAKIKMKDKFIKIADYISGLSANGDVLLGGKSKFNVTISLFMVEVKIFNLEYADEFHFRCLASGAVLREKPKLVNRSLSVISVKGGPAICGDSIIKNEYLSLVGDSYFNVTMCGNPGPKFSYAVDGKTYKVLGKEVDKAKRMYRYKMELKNIEPRNCGQAITIQATGFGQMFKKSSTLIVKYKPPMVKHFAYTKTNDQDCAIFKVLNEDIPKCPLIYQVTIYDKDKKIVDSTQNPFTFKTSQFHIFCNPDWLNKSEFAVVTPIWRHKSFERDFVGTPSELSRAEKSSADSMYDDVAEKVENPAPLPVIIPIVFGFILVIIAAVLIYKYKGRDKKGDSTKPSSDELMERQSEERNSRIYQTIDYVPV